MQIEIIGTDKRQSYCARELKRALAFGLVGGDRRLVVLPIPTTRDKVLVTGSELKISDIPTLSGEGATFCGYSIPQSVKEKIADLGGSVLDLSYDEEFLSENARLTALGTVGYILTHGESEPSDMNIGIIGYGRIGRALLRYLLLLGARVKLYTTRDSVRRELGELGVATEIMSENADFDNLSLLINTAPTAFLGKISKSNQHLPIVELASGDNFPESLSVTRLPSIPALMYPESSGKLYAKYILKGLD